MYAEQFKKDGVVVIPLFNQQETSVLKELFRSTIFSFPEYKYPKVTEDTGHSMGGFCALANPQSFHAPFFRHLREAVYQRLIPKFWDDMVGNSPDTKVELLADRALYRPVDRKPSPESWHQDLPDKKLMKKMGKVRCPDDITCGGWLNLDEFDQFFTGIKGTQHDNFSADGFARITKEMKPHYKKLAAKQGKIRIPPGCLIIFYESIVHNVTSNKTKKPMHRQFFGWRITEDRLPLFDDTIQRCKDQLPIRLKSGQEPPMYSKMHLTNWIQKLARWSQNIKDEFCYMHTVKSGPKKGEKYRICKRYIMDTKYKSTDYNQYELEILTPRRNFIMRHWKFDIESRCMYSHHTFWTAYGIEPPPEVRDVTEDIRHDENQKKREAEIDLTKRKKRRV